MAALPAHADTATAPHINRWLIVALACIPVFLGSLDLTIVSAFLPTLTLELGIPLDSGGIEDISWVLTVYLLAYAVSLFVWGRASDLLGRRAAFLICLALYMAGTLLVIFYRLPAGLLTSLYTTVGVDVAPAYTALHAVLIGRTVAAFGAGAITAVALALVGDLFPAAQRAVPLGLIAAMDTLGWLVGAAWAGFIIQFMPWSNIFLLNLPPLLLAFGLMAWGLKDVPPHRAEGRFDFIGALLIVALLTSLNAALSNLRIVSGAVDFSLVLPLLGLTAGLAVLLIIVEARTPQPLLDVGIFRRSRPYAAATALNGLIGFCLFIAFIFLPLLTNLREIEALGDGGAIIAFRDLALQNAALLGGVLMIALTIPLAISSVASGWLMRRFGTTRVTLSGALLALSGFTLLARDLTLDFDVPTMTVIMVITGIGIGAVFTAVINTTLAVVGEAQRGAASAMVLGVRMIAMMIATSALTVYSTQRVNDLLIAIESQEVISAALLRSLSPEQYPLLFPSSYAAATVQTLSEMALFGALLCAVGLLPAWLMREQKKKGMAR